MSSTDVQQGNVELGDRLVSWKLFVSAYCLRGFSGFETDNVTVSQLRDRGYLSFETVLFYS